MTNSSRSHHRSPDSRRTPWHSHRSPGNRRNPGSPMPARCLELFRYFPYRTRKMSTRSRRKFPLRRASLPVRAPDYVPFARLRPVRRSLPRRPPQVIRTAQQPPTSEPLPYGTFASKRASLVAYPSPLCLAEDVRRQWSPCIHPAKIICKMPRCENFQIENQAPEEKIPPCSSRPLAVECQVRAPFATCGENIKAIARSAGDGHQLSR